MDSKRSLHSSKSLLARSLITSFKLATTSSRSRSTTFSAPTFEFASLKPRSFRFSLSTSANAFCMIETNVEMIVYTNTTTKAMMYR